MIRVFPVAGGASYTDDFGAARGGGGHQGNDLMAPAGTPLLAVDDGEVHFGTDVLGGLIANVYSDDGARYYYAHMQAFAEPSGDASESPPARRRVTAGDLIGYLGQTGNAATTVPHLHFESHPGRGAAVDPYDDLRAAPVQSGPLALQAASSESKLLRAALLGGMAALAAWVILEPAGPRRLARRYL